MDVCELFTRSIEQNSTVQLTKVKKLRPLDHESNPQSLAYRVPQ